MSQPSCGPILEKECRAVIAIGDSMLAHVAMWSGEARGVGQMWCAYFRSSGRGSQRKAHTEKSVRATVGLRYSSS